MRKSLGEHLKHINMLFEYINVYILGDSMSA